MRKVLKSKKSFEDIVSSPSHLIIIYLSLIGKNSFEDSFISVIFDNHLPFSDRLSVTVPTVGTNALGYGAFLGLYSNLRYQLLCGLDRAMMDRFDVIGVTLFISTALRFFVLLILLIFFISSQHWSGHSLVHVLYLSL